MLKNRASIGSAIANQSPQLPHVAALLTSKSVNYDIRFRECVSGHDRPNMTVCPERLFKRSTNAIN